jgi:hypothetical protein
MKRAGGAFGYGSQDPAMLEMSDPRLAAGTSLRKSII